VKQIAVLFFFLFPCVLLAQVDITAPGVGGMKSNGDLAPGELRYMKNLDAWTSPGKLQRRQGLEGYGHTDSTGLVGYQSIYDPARNHKLIVGVGDSAYIYYDSGNVVVTSVGQLFVSDTFATIVDNGVAGFAFPYQDGYHDWTICEDGLIHCDGKNLPILLTTTDGVKVNDSTRDSVVYAPRALPIGLPAPGQLVVGNSGVGGPLQGTYQFAYAFLDSAIDSTSELSIPSAPVELKEQCAYLTQFDMYHRDNKKPLLVCRKEVGGRDEWQVLDTIYPGADDGMWQYTTLHTAFRWGYDGKKYPRLSYSYTRLLESHGVPWVGCTLTTSQWPTDWGGTCDDLYSPMDCLVDSLVRLFNAMDSIGDTIVATKVGHYMMISDSLSSWHIDTTINGVDTTFDTIPADDIDVFGNINIGRSVIYDTIPGAYHEIVYLDTLDDIGSPTIFNTATVSDTMMRPGAFLSDSVTTLKAYDALGGHYAYDDSTYYIAYSYYDPLTGLESPRGPAIAVELVDTVYAGNTDTAEFLWVTTGVPAEGRPDWLRLWQTVTNEDIVGAGDSLVWYGLYDIRHEDTSQSIIWGNWTDVHAATGIYPDSIVVATIYDHQLAIDAYGDALAQPPYKHANQLPYSDIEFCYERYWGVHNNRVYWTSINDPTDWNPVYFHRVDERVDDKIVAMKVVDGQLYVFKQRSVWLIGGSDPIFDSYVIPHLMGVGAVSYNTLCKHRSDVYFLTPDNELWPLRQGELSYPVDDFMDSLFMVSDKVTLGELEQHARLVPFNNGIKVVNDSTGECMTYWVDPQTWTAEEFSGFIPMGSFYYDSAQGTSGFGTSHIMWDSDTVALMREFLTDTRHDNLGSTEWAADIFVTGGTGGYWELTELQVQYLAENDRNFLRSEIYNHTYSLATDSHYIQSGAGFWQTLRWSLTPIQGDELYLKLYSPAYDSVNYLEGSTPTVSPCHNNFTFERLRILIQDKGRLVLEGDGDATYESGGGGEGE